MYMRKKNLYLGTIAVLFLIACAWSIPLVAASQVQGANATFVSSTTGTSPATTTAPAIGGNITAVNISGSSITDRWAGFYGNISGVVRLADAAGNKFYQWSINVITGAVVYATNGTVSNWSTLVPASYVNMPAYLVQSAADNYSNTFVANETFSTNLRSINNVFYTYTLNGSVQNSSFKTYSLAASVNASAQDNSTLVFAGKAVQQSNTFDNNAADFQIIAPARSLTTYYFYLELP